MSWVKKKYENIKTNTNNINNKWITSETRSKITKIKLIFWIFRINNKFFKLLI